MFKGVNQINLNLASHILFIFMSERLSLSTAEAIDLAYSTSAGIFTLGDFVTLTNTTNHALLHLLLLQRAQEAVPRFLLEDLVSIIEDHLHEEVRLPKHPLTRAHPLPTLVHVDRLPKSLAACLYECLITVLNTSNAHGCLSSHGVNTGYFKHLEPLLSPISARPITLSRLLPALDYLRTHPGGLVMRDPTTNSAISPSSKAEKQYERFTKLLNHNQALTRYVDPAYIMWEEGPGVGAGVAGLHLGGVDQLLNQTQLAIPVPVVAPPAAGGACTRLLQTHNSDQAREIASAYRSHSAIPGAKGGGDGPAMRFGSFTSNNLRWW